MKFDIKNTRKIEDFLDGLLTGDEEKEFVAELQKNKNLQKEVRLHKDIRSGIIKKGKKDLRIELNKYSREYKISKKGNSKIIRLLIPAISVAACILLFVFIFSKNSEKMDQTDDFITLDSVKINKAVSHADSATYEDIQEFEKDTVK